MNKIFLADATVIDDDHNDDDDDNVITHQ